MGKKQHAIYNVGEDLASLRKNKLFTKQCLDGARHYLFDVNDYPMKEPSLVPEKYALTALQSKEYALLAGKLRSTVVEKAQ